MSKHTNNSDAEILLEINKMIQDGESIESILLKCEQAILDFPENNEFRIKLEYLNDLKESDGYIEKSEEAHKESIDLEGDFLRIQKLQSYDEKIREYTLLQKKYPGHKGVEEGIENCKAENEDDDRGDLVMQFRKISQMRGVWGEPDYDGQKKKLLDLEEQYPFHEGIKAALESLEEAKANNFGRD